VNRAADCFIAAVWPPLGAALWIAALRSLRTTAGALANLYLYWVSAAAVVVICALFAGLWLWAGVATANGAVAVFLWWLSRRRRRRVPRAYGAKAKALIAAMVARMRESLKPCPVLRPVPGGAQ